MANSGKKLTSSRGEDTRAQLIEAGLILFGRHGFDGVSTRQLAQAATTNIASIAYHFGGKRELYQAVLAQIVTDTEPAIGPAVGRVMAGIQAAKGNPQGLAAIASALVAQIIRMFIEDDWMRARAALILREYMLPTDDFDILYQGRVEPLHRAVTELCAAATGLPPADPRCAMRAHAVLGQIIVFGIARVVLFKRLDWAEFTPQRLNQVIETATGSVLASLNLPTG